MEILPASVEDIDELALVEIESKKKSIPHLAEDFEIDFSLRSQRWQSYFDGLSPKTSKPERITLKAVENGGIIGYISGHLTSRYEMDSEIQSFYILKENQRRGLGTLLLEKFTGWLISHNVKSLCVGIASENIYQNFYLKHGGLHLNKHWIYWNDVLLLQQNLKNKIKK